MTILYLAGPMTGISEYNFPAFDRYAAKLRSAGYVIVSPAEADRATGFNEKGLDGNTHPEGFSYADTLLHDLHLIRHCDGLALLLRWENSNGAQAEVAFAKALQLPVKPVGLWLAAAELKEVPIVQRAFAS